MTKSTLRFVAFAAPVRELSVARSASPGAFEVAGATSDAVAIDTRPSAREMT